VIELGRQSNILLLQSCHQVIVGSGNISRPLRELGGRELASESFRCMMSRAADAGRDAAADPLDWEELQSSEFGSAWRAV
jgi:hypothetical protein